MPAAQPNVAELQALVERLINNAPTQPTEPTEPAIPDQELAMRTQTRDNLVTHLNELIRTAQAAVSTLSATNPRNISNSRLEELVQPIVMRMDNAFMVAHANLATARVGARNRDEDDDTDDGEDDDSY